MRSSFPAFTALLWFSLGAVAIFACNGAGAGRSTSAGAANGADMSAASSGGAGGAFGRGDALGGASSGGRLDSGMTEAGASGAAALAGTPLVIVGSTDGMLRAFAMDERDGSVSPAGSVDGPEGLEFIALGPDDRTVFATRDSAITAYVYDPKTQNFSPRGDG